MHSEKFLDGAILPAVRELGYPIAVNPDVCFLRTRADHSVMATDCLLRGQTRDWVRGEMKEVVEKVLERKCSDPYNVQVPHHSIRCVLNATIR
jgi:hypothetical protein